MSNKAPDFPPAPYHSIWDAQFDRSKRSIDPLRNAIPALFQKHLRAASTPLYVGTPGLELDQDTTDTILSEIEEKAHYLQHATIQNAFRQALAGLNKREQCHVALPPIRQVISRFANLIKPQHFVKLPLLQEIEASLLERLSEVLAAPADILAGAILFSSAAYDGQLGSAKIDALCSISASAIHFPESQALVDLGQAGVFFPCDLTQVLLFHFDRRFGLPLCNVSETLTPQTKAVSPEMARRALGQFLPLLSVLAKDCLVTQLPTLCRPLHATVFPGYLLAYVHSINVSTALPLSQFLQIYKTTEESKNFAASPRNPVQAKKRASNANHNKTDREKVMQKIREVIEELCKVPTAISPSEAKEKITALMSIDAWPIQVLVANYVKVHIDKIAIKGGAWSSLRRYYCCLWWPLLAAAESTDPLELDALLLENLIDRSLQLHRSPSTQIYFQRQVAEFLKYLHDTHGTPKIDMIGLDHWLQPTTGRPNADWITPTEFDRAITLLQEGTIVKEPWLQEVCILVARLNYRLGLRRLEPLQARVMDLQNSKTPELLVRESLFGTLKSDQADRRLPIYGPLPDLEAAELLTYRNYRADLVGLDAPLFASPNAPDIPLTEEQVFRPITAALVAATGRSEVVVHLLRHSFANVTLLQCEVADGTIALPRSDLFGHPIFDHERCTSVKNAFFRRVKDDPLDVGDGNVFALSVAMGHLSPGTTIRSYVHLLDLLVALHVHPTLPFLRNPQFLADALGVKKSRFYKLYPDKKSRIGALPLAYIMPEVRQRYQEERASRKVPK